MDIKIKVNVSKILEAKGNLLIKKIKKCNNINDLFFIINKSLDYVDACKKFNVTKYSNMIIIYQIVHEIQKRIDYLYSERM